MRICSWWCALVAVPLVTLGAQLPPPTATQVSAKAQAVHLDVSRAARTTVAGRTATFTPVAEVDLPPSAKALESGAVLGVLAVAGSGGTLAPGQYTVYLSRTTNGWEAALEQNGRIATVSRAVTIASYPIEHGIPKPMITTSDSAADDVGLPDAGPHISLDASAPVVSGGAPMKGSIAITESGKGWKVVIVLLRW